MEEHNYNKALPEKYENRRQNIISLYQSARNMSAEMYHVAEMSGVSYFWLRFHSYSDKFSSDPKVFLISYSDSKLFKVWETNVVTLKLHFILASFLVSILKFDTRLRLQQINKNRTPTALRIRQKRHIPTPIRLRLWVLPIFVT